MLPNSFNCPIVVALTPRLNSEPPFVVSPVDTFVSVVPFPSTIAFKVNAPPVAVTVPEPAGVAHVPSPRQKVDADALVPELRFVTGRFPVTPVVNGNPVAFVNTPADGVPMFGVVSIGEACITNVLPVPVCAATAVAFPVLVIGPVRLAFVVTVAAFPVVFWFSVGKSPATAMVKAPVVVVLFKIPVASADVPAL